jgi:hypothetical protein
MIERPPAARARSPLDGAQLALGRPPVPSVRMAGALVPEEHVTQTPSPFDGAHCWGLTDGR